MSVSKKELAFLRGLIEDDWTAKFTGVFDKKCDLKGKETILYLNAGSGNHALGLSEKLDENSQMFAVCENKELQQIAQEKATALKSDLDFSTSFPVAKSELVIADASFVKPSEIGEFVNESALQTKDQLAVLIPTAGSFGEVFSYLWEVFLDLDMLDKEADVERLISELPTVSGLKDLVQGFALTKVECETKRDFVEYENGKEFVDSPLMKFFLMPSWLDFLDEKENEQVIEKLAQKIDDERDGLSFRCSIKATLFTAQRSKA